MLTRLELPWGTERWPKSRSSQKIVEFIFGTTFFRLWLLKWDLETCFFKPPLKLERDVKYFGMFEITFDLGPILMQHWHRFDIISAAEGRLGASWGHLGGVLGRLGAV